ncbi:hypothetical protein RB195_004925 [Necator americanus]|uniref:Uncharacterized protein n=1 Tax=Necator americanus TaxID=51031 RepID=A0ABR1BP92_NECAM
MSPMGKSHHTLDPDYDEWMVLMRKFAIDRNSRAEQRRVQRRHSSPKMGTTSSGDNTKNAKSPKMNRKEECIAVTNELALYQDLCGF